MDLIDLGEMHLPAVQAILNDAIGSTTAIYDEQPRSLETMRTWFTGQQQAGRPVIGVVGDGVLLGYGSYGSFRLLPGYRLTVEHSIYVAVEARNRGVGRLLLDELIRRAIGQGLHTMVGVIDADNDASRRLHESRGFSLVGTMPQVATKFGRWLDVCLYQRIISPAQPAPSSLRLPADSAGR